MYYSLLDIVLILGWLASELKGIIKFPQSSQMKHEQRMGSESQSNPREHSNI